MSGRIAARRAALTGLGAAFASASLAPLAPLAVRAQPAWPSKTITLLVPFTPGTGMDMLARTLAPRLSQRLGQAVVVDNKPGASGNLGTGIAAQAPADGHTLLVTANTFVTNPSLFEKIPYDPQKSFAPVALATQGALALAVHPSFPARTLPEAIRVIKAAPGKYSYASPGNGTPQHLAMELLCLNAGLEMVHVPYKGSAGAITDLLGGQVQAMVLPVHSALGHAKAGRLAMLGVAQPNRSAAAPDVPTFAEQGVRNADVDLWFGVLAPVGTPAPVLARLNAEIVQILQQPDVVESLDKAGMVPTPGPAEALATLVRNDQKRWAELIRQAKITAD